MELLYKYYTMTAYALENLQNDTVCFSDIASFNDPYEIIGNYYYKSSQGENDFFDKIGVDLDTALNCRIAKDSTRLLRFKHRVFCVTEDFDNPLMWAHYAAAHKGFCVGYAKDDLVEISAKAQHINYLESPISICTNNLDMEEIEKLLFAKSSIWSYEREWRFIYMLNAPDVEHLDFFENHEKCFSVLEDPHKMYVPHGYASQNNHEVLASDRYILKHCPPQKIFFGLRMGTEDSQKVMDCCKSKPHIEFFKMTQEKSSFNMIADPIHCKRQAQGHLNRSDEKQ